MDTYLVLLMFVAFFRKAQRVSRTDRRWLRFHLFARHDTQAYRDPNLRGRYLETTQLGRRLHALSRHAQRAAAAGGNPHVSTRWTTRAKKERILALPAPAKAGKAAPIKFWPEGRAPACRVMTCSLVPKLRLGTRSRAER